jgi:hypothetical protein
MENEAIALYVLLVINALEIVYKIVRNVQHSECGCCKVDMRKEVVPDTPIPAPTNIV